MKIGIDASIIQPSLIKYKGELTDGLLLTNENEKVIIYFDYLKGFTLFTDDPCNSWLTCEDLLLEWVKPPEQGLMYCLKQALNQLR